MARHYKRVGFTPAQSAELWDRWHKGEGLKSIGRELGKPSSCIFSHLKPTGGIRPPARRRSRPVLTLAEREEISRGLVAERSIRSIARSLGRSRSTISREIERNGGVGATEPREPTNGPGIKPSDRSGVIWHDIHACAKRWRRSSGITGHLSRTLAG